MAKHVQFGPWTIALDERATVEASSLLVPGTERCGCFFCRQFRHGRATLNYDFFDQLTTLSLDPERETDVTHFRELEDGSHLFLGWYHIVGDVVAGPAEGIFHRWGDEVEVTLARRRDALPDTYPEPALQIDFIVRLPWRGMVLV